MLNGWILKQGPDNGISKDAEIIPTLDVNFALGFLSEWISPDEKSRKSLLVVEGPMPPFGAEVFPAVMQHVQFFQADRPSFVELRLNKIQYGRRALAEQDVSTGLPEAVLR